MDPDGGVNVECKHRELVNPLIPFKIPIEPINAEDKEAAPR